MGPRIAIIMVCRNAISLVAVTLESVNSQSHPNKQFIVVDGGSTDGTFEYLQSWRGLIDIFISESDHGIYDAMNKGVEACAADAWVIFLNAGDQFVDRNLLNSISELLRADLDFLIGDVLIENSAGARTVRCDLNRRHEMPACHQSMFSRASVLKKLKFDLKYSVGADFDLYVRATRDSGLARVAVYSGAIAKVAPQGYSVRNEAILRRDYFQIIARDKSSFAAWEWLSLRYIRHVLRSGIEYLKRPAR
jgi:glycosyltransferase involved in cell wall biosynthesis